MTQTSRTLSLLLAFLTTFIIFPSLGAAQSNEPPAKEGSGAPSPQRSPAASPTTAPATGATGDWGGERAALAKRGIGFRGHYVAEAAANPIGGLLGGTAYASELMLGSDVDLGRLNGNGLGTIHFTFTARQGSSLSKNAIGNIFTVQEIYGSGLTPRLTELSYEQPLASGKVNVVLGRVITENDFAASSTYWGGNLYCSYQSNAICGTPIAAPINSGYDAYPQSAWGVRVKGLPTPNWYAQAGAYQINPSYGLRGLGFNLGWGDNIGTYLPFETGVLSLDADRVPTGSLRVGGYYDTSNYATVESNLSRFAPSAVTSLPSQFYRGRYGYWIQADHLIAGGAGSKARGAAVFAAYEFGDPQTALLTNFFDAGIVQHGTFPGRDHDTVALGYAYGNVNSRLRSLEESLRGAGQNVPLNGQEQIAELNYGVQLLPWLALRPGLQYVWHPSGDASIPNALVLDLSTAITF